MVGQRFQWPEDFQRHIPQTCRSVAKEGGQLQNEFQEEVEAEEDCEDEKAIQIEVLMGLVHRQGLDQSGTVICALSGRRITPAKAEVDHVVPLSKGGEHVIDNLQIVSRTINRMKGQMTNAQFVAMCRKVVEYAEKSGI